MIRLLLRFVTLFRGLLKFIVGIVELDSEMIIKGFVKMVKGLVGILTLGVYDPDDSDDALGS